jgi:hypothetical protein
MIKKCSIGLHTRVKDKRNLIANFSHFLDCKYNPEFTEEDIKKKCEIFNIPNVKTDFITNKSLSGCREHYIDLVGRFSKIINKKIIGSDSEWNIIPVSGKNSEYKKKSLEVSEDEIESLSEDEKVIYDKLNRWKKYVDIRGAHMYHKITDRHIELLQEHENIMVETNKLYFDKLCSQDL